MQQARTARGCSSARKPTRKYRQPNGDWRQPSDRNVINTRLCDLSRTDDERGLLIHAKTVEARLRADCSTKDGALALWDRQSPHCRGFPAVPHHGMHSLQVTDKPPSCAPGAVGEVKCNKRLHGNRCSCMHADKLVW